MPTFTTSESHDRYLTFNLPAHWPQGASIGELRRMMAAVERKLTNLHGPEDASSDTVAWVIPGDDKISVRIQMPKPEHGP